MWNFLGGAVGALGSIYGASQNAAATNQANVFNYDLGVANLDYQKATQAQNIAEQEKFAQNAVQWKAADARAAGINPLAALGAPVMSFSNTVAPQNTAQWQAGSPGAGFSQAGQSLGRAISAIQTQEDRATSQAADALKLQNMSLQNQLLESQIAGRNNTGTGPALPAGDVKVIPDQVTATPPDNPSQTAGYHPPIKLINNPDGSISVGPSHDMSVDMFNPSSQEAWDYNHKWLPALGMNRPDLGTPEGYYRYFNPWGLRYSQPIETPWHALNSNWKGSADIRRFYGYPE